MAAFYGGRPLARSRPDVCTMRSSCLVRLLRPAAPAAANRPTSGRNCLPPGRSRDRRWQVACAGSSSAPGGGEEPEELDSNQLQTALNNAIAAEDYALAGRLSARLKAAQGADNTTLDWRALGVPDWLAERAEQLGYRFPTEVQRRCCAAMQGGGHDVVVQSQTGSGKTLAFLMPLLSLLDYPPKLYPDDLKGPQLVVLVPSTELGVQEALLVYKLFGGSVNPGIPGAAANMFAYSGPRGLKVRGVLTDEEAFMSRQPGFLAGCHVLVSTPDRLAALSRLPEASELFVDLKALAVDEVDACFQEHSGAMERLLGRACTQPGGRKPTVAFVGATLSDSLADQACQMGWLVDPTMILPASGGGGGGKPRVPLGLQHRYITVPQPRKLAALCRQLRADLQTQGEDSPPPRVIVFAGSEEAAAAAADPLRTALWGQHRLAVLLPHGEEPIKAMHSFRDNAATFLLATPAAARGLDLPAVSHVYSLDCPDATEYLHRAGRAGRIGSPVKGVVTTLVTPEEAPALQAVARELGIHLQEQPEPEPGAFPDPEADIDGAKRTLEDLFNLL